MNTPIRAEITNTQKIQIWRSAFSRLLLGKFEGIEELNLGEGAFIFENQGKSHEADGLISAVIFKNVSIPILPKSTFVSALGKVEIHSSKIGTIESDAFAATVIRYILINDTNISRLKKSAISDKTLIDNLVFSKCKISAIEYQGIMAGIANLTIQFSLITDINQGAISIPASTNIIISDNKIRTVQPNAFAFDSWNNIFIENNIITNLGSKFLLAPYHNEIVSFSFVSNEIWNVSPGSFAAFPILQEKLEKFKFNNNVFNKTCHCNISNWMSDLLDNSNNHYAFTTSFCSVNELLSRCFQIEQGWISMKNFSDLVCGPGKEIHCSKYEGETKSLNESSILELEENKSNNYILYVVIITIVIVALTGTIIILLVRAMFWLRMKECPSRPRQEDQDAIVEESYEIPELTPELLAHLREQLNNPSTHENAREMIERLYEHFVVSEESTNNNRQQDEPHLYEELSSMQSGRPLNYLKAIEDKLNIPYLDDDYHLPPYQDTNAAPAPALVNEYSEPSDTAVHLYSELKNKIDEAGSTVQQNGTAIQPNEYQDSLLNVSQPDVSNNFKTNGSLRSQPNGSLKSVHSAGSGKMAFRPLPAKPTESRDQAGPSNVY